MQVDFTNPASPMHPSHWESQPARREGPVRSLGAADYVLLAVLLGAIALAVVWMWRKAR